MYTRRRFLATGAVTAATALLRTPPAAAATSDPVPVMPIDLVFVGPEATEEIAATQLGALAEVYAPHGLSFTVVTRRPGRSGLPQRIDTRADRDALVADFRPGAANVFLVTSLEDVDEANRHRFGVCWRNEHDPEKRYVVVASYAPRGVLAHELGHLLGLSHRTTVDNVMSYTRTEGVTAFFTAEQAATMRRTARAYFASGFFRRSETASPRPSTAATAPTR